MQYFKGDQLELQIYNAASSLFTNIDTSLNSFHDNCYTSVPWGAMLFDTGRAPLTNAIRRDIYITCFNELFTSWQYAGCFESYISLFKKIFGEDSVIEFVVPAAGQLEINIESSGVATSFFIGREIAGNEYNYVNITDSNGDKILFRNPQGFETQEELETVMQFLSPVGIFVTVSLTIA